MFDKNNRNTESLQSIKDKLVILYKKIHDTVNAYPNVKNICIQIQNDIDTDKQLFEFFDENDHLIPENIELDFPLLAGLDLKRVSKREFK